MNYTVHPRLTLVVACALAIAATACSTSPRPQTQAVPTEPPATTPTTASATTTPKPAATSKPKPTAILSNQHTIALGLTADIIVPAGPVVYALSMRNGTVGVVRMDITKQAVTARRSFRGNSVRASVGGGRLAVLTTSPTTIRELDLRTLQTDASAMLSTPAADVLARPEATYVSTPGHILALDPQTLRTRRSVRVDDSPAASGAKGAAIAADPRSQILYAGIPNGQGPPPVVDVVDLRAGRVIARPTVDAVVDAEPQGYGDDAWVVFATGMMASAERLDPTGKKLAQIGPIGPNSSTIAVTGRHLWTFSPSTFAPIACRDLSTGAVQGSAAHPEVGVAAAADNTHVYLSVDDSLLVFTPSGRCA